MIRWNISFYQLKYVFSERNIPVQDLGEAIGACILHAIMVAEYFGIQLLPKTMIKDIEFDADLIKYHVLNLLCLSTSITRQLVYHKMGRTNRFSGAELMRDLRNFLGVMFAVLGHEWSTALSIAMSKLQDQELNFH